MSDSIREGAVVAGAGPAGRAAAIRWSARILPVLALLLALPLAACGRVETWRQELVLRVATPWGTREGRTVTAEQLTDTHGPLVPPDARGVSSDVRGEALVVDVRPDAPRGEPRYLIVTLDGIMALTKYRIDAELPPDRRSMEWTERLALIRAEEGRAIPVPTDDLPLMVTFLDAGDPTTVRRVVPNDAGPDYGSESHRTASREATLTFAEAFGEGVSLLVAEVTPLPGEGDVTQGVIEPVLPWLHWSRERMLEIGGGPNPVFLPTPRGGENHLGRTTFRRD